MTSHSRRSFIKQSVAGLAAAGIASNVRVTAASQDRVAGANKRVRVALVGCGGMGSSDLRDTLKLGGQVVALCDVDDDQVRKAKDWVSTEFSQTPDLTTRDFRA